MCIGDARRAKCSCEEIKVIPVSALAGPERQIQIKCQNMKMETQQKVLINVCFEPEIKIFCFNMGIPGE